LVKDQETSEDGSSEGVQINPRNSDVIVSCKARDRQKNINGSC